MLPSASTSPTGSYCIIVTIIYDNNPTETSWKLRSIDLDGNGLALFTLSYYTEANEDATSHTETICLTEGDYYFSIYDYYGLCCDEGEGHYNVTTLDGKVIAEGGEFSWEEATRFSIPFAPAS